MDEVQRVVPSLALVAHGEGLLARRRVLVVGDSFSCTAEALLERGARLVEVRDPNTERVSEAATRNPSRHVTYAPLNLGSGGVRDGAFDLALVENLAMVKEPAELLKSVRRALSADGVAYIASPNPAAETRLLPEASALEPPEYYELFDLISADFGEVRMLGLAPYVGYAVADFAVEGEPAVAMDGGFVRGGAEEPEWFVALAAQTAISCDEFTLVQLPCDAVLASVSGSSELRAAREAARDAERRAAQVEARSRRAVERSQLDADALKKRLESGPSRGDNRNQARVEELELLASDLEKRGQAAAKRADTAERQLKAADRRADSAEQRADAESDRANAAQERLAQKQERSEDHTGAETRLRHQLQTATDDLEAARRDAKHAQQELAARNRDLAKVEGLQSAREDLVELETRLEERSSRIRVLEADAKEAERMGLELQAELELLRADISPAPQVQQLAQLEADLAAARFRIQQLEGQLEDAPRAELSAAGAGPTSG